MGIHEDNFSKNIFLENSRGSSKLTSHGQSICFILNPLTQSCSQFWSPLQWWMHLPNVKLFASMHLFHCGSSSFPSHSQMGFGQSRHPSRQFSPHGQSKILLMPNRLNWTTSYTASDYRRVTRCSVMRLGNYIYHQSIPWFLSSIDWHKLDHCRNP